MITIISVLVITYYDNLFDVINGRLTSSSGSNNGRMELFFNGLSIWSHYPIFGAGPRSFIWRIPEYGSFPTIAHDAHHTWSNLLAEVGFLPVLLLTITYLVAFAVIFKKQKINEQILLYYKQRKLTKYFFITIIVLLMLWSNFTGLIYTDKIPWIFLSLLFSYNKILSNFAIKDTVSGYNLSKKCSVLK